MDTLTISRQAKISAFTDLHAWQEGHKLVVTIYQATKKFPADERFELTNQLRRAAVSITSNIAEGFSRQSYKEKVQFYAISLGSITEVQNQILIAKDVGYLEKEDYEPIQNNIITASKLVNGLIKSSKALIHNS